MLDIERMKNHVQQLLSGKSLPLNEHVLMAHCSELPSAEDIESLIAANEQAFAEFSAAHKLPKAPSGVGVQL